MPHSMWDLSSLTKDPTCVPCIGTEESQPLDHQGSSLPEILRDDSRGFNSTSYIWLVQKQDKTVNPGFL